MDFKRASKTDFGEIKILYETIIECTPGMTLFARWKKGIHPSDEAIRAYIREGAMYLLKRDGILIGAVAITMKQDETYHAIEWSTYVNDKDVAVIHILGVNPAFQKAGIGKELLKNALSLAKESKKAAVRLDALASNLPARKMYENNGFLYQGKQLLFAENTGWTEFCFYECVL